MFRFENMSALMLLWMVPVLVGISIIASGRARAKMNRIMGEKLVPFLTSSVSVRRRRWKLILQCVVLILMVFALARPQMGQSKQEIKSEGVELVFVVDVSDSMMAEDVRPNRLEQAKTELSKLIDLMPGNKIGVVAFAGSAAVMSPLTTDPNSLRMYLDSLSPNSVSAQGTNFQSAIEEAAEAFKRGGVDADDTVKVTRVIVVASDGEDHEPGANAAAEKLTKEGIRIFALAYGTEKGAPIPVRDSMGFMRGYKKDKSGQTVLTTVKGAALQALAQSGKGTFYHAAFGGSHIQNLASDISKLEKTQFDSEIATQYDEKFQIFLLLAVLLALIEILMGERAAASRVWKGRFEVTS